MLKEIVFGDEFNQPINNLPHSLQELHFRRSFNQSVDHLAPYVTLINFGQLYFGKQFNQPDHLPPALLLLKLGKCFNQELNCLPSGLVELYIISPCFYYSLDLIPLSVARLELSTKYSGVVKPSKSLNIVFFSNEDDADQ